MAQLPHSFKMTMGICAVIATSTPQAITIWLAGRPTTAGIFMAIGFGAIMIIITLWDECNKAIASRAALQEQFDALLERRAGGPE
jgi:hypothetical protein